MKSVLAGALIAGLLATIALPALATQVTLVEDRQPACTIVLAAQPTRAAQFAAAELQWHLEQITGATVPMARDDQTVTGTRILVGESTATLALGLRNADFEPQEYLLRVRPDLIVLMGRDKDDRREFSYDKVDTWPELFDEQGSAYAVYDFLEKFCEVRWYIPTELGLCCPHRRTLTVSGADVRRAPVMKTRTQSVNYQFPADLCGDTVTSDKPTPPLAWREQMLWWHRVRLGGEAYDACHSLNGYYDRFLEEHPEYFSQGGQGRPTQMCYTNEGLIQQVIQDAEDYFEGKGLKPRGVAAGDYFSVVPMDNSGWCRCPTCAPVLPTGPTRGKGQHSNDSASNYLFGFVNRVAQAVEKKYPDKYISALAYSSYAWPPSDQKLAPNVSIQMCLLVRAVYSQATLDNDWEVIKAWVDDSPERRKLLWLYYCFPSLSAAQGQYRCFPGFFGHSVVEQMARYHAAGIRGLYYEPSYLAYGQRSALMDQVESLVTWKLADDPTVDGNAYIDEFFTRYYGHAAAPMKKFYEMVEGIYADPANYPAGVRGAELQWEYLGTAERMAELGKLMEQAKQSVRTSLERRRVELFEKGLWQYMVKGRDTYVALASAPIQSASVPRIPPPATDDPAALDWSRAAVLANWKGIEGRPRLDKHDQQMEGRLLHDGQYLYVRLQDMMDPKKLADRGGIWNDDEYELFFGETPGPEYSQIGVSFTGRHGAYRYPGSTLWDSGVRLVSDLDQPDRWVLYLTFPLDQLLPGGVQAGDRFYMNVLRSMRVYDAVAWNPTLGGYHNPRRMGEITLQKGTEQ